jgi:hypothetical protein
MAEIPSAGQYRSELAKDDVSCESCGKRFRMPKHVLQKVRARGDRVLCMDCLEERSRMRANRRTASRPAVANRPSSGSAANKSECFIATAVYGSETAPAVVTLREFRNRFLLGNVLGSAFVEFYYRFSPTMAAYVRRWAWLRQTCHFLLSPIVTVAKFLRRGATVDDD